MDIQPKQSITDDQELAKVLAGITAGADGTDATNLADELEEDSDSKTSNQQSNASTNVLSSNDAPNDAVAEVPPIDKIESTVATEGTLVSAPTVPTSANGSLDAIKHDALNELRPLVDKLNLSAEEKFDTYLLIIRSTDDSSLVAPAFEAARAIADETGKAQALFEIVKEIDYLSNPQKPMA